ncbi:MAG: nuclear transport factor 2 family protein [Flavisolibacter sp.]
MNHKPLLLFLCLGVLFFPACSHTKRMQREGRAVYIPADQNLYDTIAHQDSLLFAAFNSRDLEGLKQFFSPDLELYQDNIGVRNYEQTVEAFKGLFAKDYVLTRRLVEGSLEVYPIKGYGGIETGKHRFCHTENGKLECGIFKFLHIWEKRDGMWKITRIVTYDHKD